MAANPTCEGLPVEPADFKDPAVLARFLEEQRLQLLAYIERQLGDALRGKVDAQDIFQEVSVSALRALPQTDLKEHAPFGWLCQLAQQRIIDAHRRFFGTKKRGGAR